MANDRRTMLEGWIEENGCRSCLVAVGLLRERDDHGPKRGLLACPGLEAHRAPL